MRRTTAIAAFAAIALAAAGCSSSSSSSSEPSSSSSAAAGGNTVDIYSSLPMQGASSAQTIPLVNGIKLALSQAGGKAGQFTVNYQVLDDSTAAAGKWDPGQTAANARKVASDPKAVFYIGEFNSGASEVSIPILNEAGIPQVSPANTYVGLTTNLPGSAPGEPQKYYPTGKRTYLRIVPIDSIQAAADLIAMKNAGCTKVAVANDKEAYEPAWPPCSSWRRATTGSRSSATPGSTRPPPTSAPTHRRSRARAPTASSSPASSPTARSRSPRTSTRRSPRPRSSAATGYARAPTPPRRRAASRPRSTR